MKIVIYTTILWFFTIAVVAMTPPAMTVTFLYDDAGNRTERQIFVNESKSTDFITDSIYEVLSDDFLKNEMATENDETDHEQSHTRVYPNPAKNILYIETSLANHGKTDCFIYDLHGRKVEHIENIGTKHSINTGNYPPGTYVLIIVNEESTLMYKIVKK